MIIYDLKKYYLCLYLIFLWYIIKPVSCYTLEEQDVVTNEFLDVIEANDVIGDLKDTCAGYEFDVVDVSFPNRTLPENIDEQIKGFVDKTYRNEYDELETHIFNLKFSRTVFQNTWLVLFVV